MSRKSAWKTLATMAAPALLMLSSITGCKSGNVFLTVENASGETLHNVKVTYPGDELTIKTLTSSTTYGTHRHFDSPGDLGVSYSTEDGRIHSSSGPRVTGKEKGEVKVSIDGSSASFETKFEESRQ